MDGAGAALSDAAAVFGARQPDRLAQHPQKWGVGVDVDLMSRAVHAKSSHMQISDESPGAKARIGAVATPRSRRPLSGMIACFYSNMEIATSRANFPAKRRDGTPPTGRLWDLRFTASRAPTVSEFRALRNPSQPRRVMRSPPARGCSTNPELTEASHERGTGCGLRRPCAR